MAGTAGAYRGRIAPSPTGYLHLGHARTFLIAAERAATGTLILRQDDLDRDRVRPEYIKAMLEDLAWLGLRWQEGPQLATERGSSAYAEASHLCASNRQADTQLTSETGEYGPYRQSARMEQYEAALVELERRGLAYRCTCSRRDLQTAISAPHAEDDDEPIYPGRCRPLATWMSGDDADSVQRSTAANPGALRFRVPDGESVTFQDGNLGPQRFVAGVDFGDFVIQRRDGLPSYQLACAVDDAAMRITEVVRGRDLLKSTARQILLQRALGLPTPAYFHCELLVDEHGTRLAKRSDALSLRALRQAGHTPDAVRAMAMAAATR